MRLLFCLLSLCLLLPTAGCRDAVVDPLPDEFTPGMAPPSEEVGEFYVKGPIRMVRGQESEFRTEPNPESVGFSWYFEGEPLLEVASPGSRITHMTAREYGSAVIVVMHYDAEGRRIGFGRRRVDIVLD